MPECPDLNFLTRYSDTKRSRVGDSVAEIISRRSGCGVVEIFLCAFLLPSEVVLYSRLGS